MESPGPAAQEAAPDAPKTRRAPGHGTVGTGTNMLRSAPWRLASFLFPQLNIVILSIAAARYLGPSQMGQQSYMAFIEITVVSLAQGGASTTLTRYLSEALGAGDLDRAARVVRWGRAVVGINAILGTGVVVAAMLFSHGYRTAWTFVAIWTFLAVCNGVPTATMSALQLWRQTALYYLFADLVLVALTVGALARGYGIAGMFAVEVVGSVAAVTSLSRFARRGLRTLGVQPQTRLRAEPLWGPLTRFSLVAAAQVAVTLIVFRRTELFFLRHYSNNGEIAIYSIAFASVAALTQLPSTLQTMLLPTYSAFWGAGQRKRLRLAVARSVRLTFVLSLPLACIAAALAPRFMTIAYGARYHEVGEIVRLLLPSLAIVPVCSARTTALSAMAILRVPLLCNIIAAVVDLTLSALLIPHLGARGAAIASVSAGVTAIVPVFFYARRRVGRMEWDVHSVLATLAASAAAGLAGLGGVHVLAGAPGLLLGLAFAGVTFFLLAHALRVISAPDAAWLRRAGGGRLLGLVDRGAIWFGAA